jgi:hypothetical protein
MADEKNRGSTVVLSLLFYCRASAVLTDNESNGERPHARPECVIETERDRCLPMACGNAAVGVPLASEFFAVRLLQIPIISWTLAHAGRRQTVDCVIAVAPIDLRQRVQLAWPAYIGPLALQGSHCYSSRPSSDRPPRGRTELGFRPVSVRVPRPKRVFLRVLEGPVGKAKAASN